MLHTITANETGATTNLLQDYESILRSFRTIFLSEMDSVQLFNRRVSKYILPTDRVGQLLDYAENHFSVLQIGDLRMADYETLYYDQEKFASYHDHINGKLIRCKVRRRSYLNSNDHFLEIKHKFNTGQTQKSRIPIDIDNREWIGEACNFTHENARIDFLSLSPVLKNRFKRITLVDFEKTQRITIDLNITFLLPDEIGFRRLENMSIIEIKQEKYMRSQLCAFFHENGFKNLGISKYCLGMSMLYPELKANGYKKKYLYIKKITGYGIV